MANTPLNNITIDGKLYDVLNGIPKKEHELIYTDKIDGEDTLVTKPLMYTDGLVVDNNDDFELCKQGADVSMSTVSSTWVKWGDNNDAAEWGYYSSDGSKTGELMANNYKFTDFYLNGEPEGYIYNTKNTAQYTGYYSPYKFKDYNSHIAVGIMSQSTSAPFYSSRPSENDNASIVPVLNIDTNGNNLYYGISISTMNSYDTSGSGYGPSRLDINSGKEHTISIVCWKLNDLKTKNTGINLLSREEGISIIEYNEKFNNCSSTGLASVIQTKIKKYNDIITLWFSDPYSTYDNDGEHQVHSDRPVVINLNDYTVTYTDKLGETTIKNFNDNPTVVEIFDKLRGGARRGYEVNSNPGSIFRNLTTDEIILNMSPDSNFNTTWKYYQDSGWTKELETPTQFFTGSRLSFNKITNKLFYSDGVDVTYIGNISSGSTNEGENTIKYENGQNIIIDDNTINCILGNGRFIEIDTSNPGNNNEINCTLTGSTTIGISNAGVISGLYTGGDGIQINGNVINCTLTGGDNIKIENGVIKLDGLMINVTYSNLRELVENESLIPGMKYCLTDYECFIPTDYNSNVQSIIDYYDTFYIIITADSKSTLNENVRFKHRIYIDADLNTQFKNCNLSAWEGKYSLDNDTTRFAWADDTPSGKGVIYWLKDEWGNECPYDFKHIQFKRYYITDINAGSCGFNGDSFINPFIYKDVYFGIIEEDGSHYPKEEYYKGYYGDEVKFYYNENNYNFYFTFTKIDSVGNVKDASINGCANDNIIKHCYVDLDPTNKKYTLNDIVFVSKDDQILFNNNKFEINCQHNTFGNDCLSNYFGVGCCYNLFGDICMNNILGDYCMNNIFCYETINNKLGNDCYDNILSINCYDNTLGNNCVRNVLGNGCYGNVFGEICSNNNISAYFNNNTFGNNFNYNRFESDYTNSCNFGNGMQYCYYNITGASDKNLNGVIFLNKTVGSESNNLNLNKTYKIIEDEEGNQISELLKENVLDENIVNNKQLICGLNENNLYRCKNMFEAML